MMKSHSSRSLVLAALLAGVSISTGPVYAAQASPPAPVANEAAKPATSAQNPATADPRFKVSNEGFQAERDIRDARIAIFDGQIEAAKTFLNQAKTDLDAVAKASTPPIVTSANASQGGGAVQVAKHDLIPIDGQMIVADNMVMTPEKADKINQANQHLKAGESDKAMEVLKQGNIDVAFTRVLMPLSATVTHVAAAQGLVDSGKFYEASMALKAAQDGLQADTVTYVEPAGQKSAPAGQNQPANTTAPKT